MAQLISFLLQAVFAVPSANHLSQLGPVRGDDGRARITAIVAPFGVDQDRFAQRLGVFNHLRNVGQAPFAVIGKQDRIVQRQNFSITIQQRRQNLVIGLFFKVNAEHLLGAANHTQLDNRGHTGVFTEFGLNTLLGQQGF